MNQSRLSAFLIRVVLGLRFTIHGWPKVFDLFGDGSGWPAEVESLDLEPAFVFAAVIAFGEALSGVAMILGVLPRLAGLTIMLIMAGAVWCITGAKGYSDGYEYNLALMVMALSVILTGPGAYAWELRPRKAER